jgi:hypothetical protein
MAFHPLFGVRILHAERLAPTRDPRLEDIQAIPFEPERDRPFPSLVEPSRVVVLRGFPSNRGAVVCMPRSDGSRVDLHWAWDTKAGSDRWQLRGELDLGSSRAPVRHDGEPANINVWQRFAQVARGIREGRWDEGSRLLKLSFEEVEEAEVESFRRDLMLTAVELPGLGAFARVLARDVPLGPATANDARRWAQARLEHRIESMPAYRTRQEVRSLWASLVDQTPLEAEAPPIPTQAELLERLAAIPSQRGFWSVAAPVDLAPEEVPVQLLGGAI